MLRNQNLCVKLLLTSCSSKRNIFVRRWAKEQGNHRQTGASIGEEVQVVTLLGSLLPSYSTTCHCRLDFVQQALIHEGAVWKKQTSKTAYYVGTRTHMSILSKETMQGW